MMNTTTRTIRLAAAASVALLAVAVTAVTVTPAGIRALDESERIFIQHVDERLLDTRGDAPPSDGWTTNVQLPEYTRSGIDWNLNVQVVQASGDGWVEVSGQSAVVYDAGRANNSISTFPLEAGGFIPVTVHGASAHVIIDLVAFTGYVSSAITIPPCEAGSTDCP